MCVCVCVICTTINMGSGSGIMLSSAGSRAQTCSFICVDSSTPALILLKNH